MTKEELIEQLKGIIGRNFLLIELGGFLGHMVSAASGTEVVSMLYDLVKEDEGQEDGYAQGEMMEWGFGAIERDIAKHLSEEAISVKDQRFILKGAKEMLTQFSSRPGAPVASLQRIVDLVEDSLGSRYEAPPADAGIFKDFIDNLNFELGNE